MNRFLSFIFILLFLFLSSCSDDHNQIGIAFESEDYDRVIAIADEKLRSSLDLNAIYYKAASYFRLGDLKMAKDCSYLYLLSSKEKDESYYNAAQILLRASDDYHLSLYAGDILFDGGRLNRVDYLLYYQALVENGDYDRADEFYQSISLGLTGYEKALIALSGRYSSEKMVNALEELYSQEGISEHFKTLMKRTIPLFIEKGDQRMLLNLVSYGDSSDSSYALYVGDLYFSLGMLEEASLYWNKASDDFPVQSRIRIRNL